MNEFSKIDIVHNMDCLEGLRKMPSDFVDCCITSPPYFGLRDYGCEGQIGLEESPTDYINRLTKVFMEVYRVMKPDGTLWVVIGDSYAGSLKGAAKDPENALKYKQGTNKGTLFKNTSYKYRYNKNEQCKNKDLIGIPWMLAFSLRNNGWYLRQDIIWHKRNSMPESVKDRCTKSHEYIFLLSKSQRYYFDSSAISEPCICPPRRKTLQTTRIHIDTEETNTHRTAKCFTGQKAGTHTSIGKEETSATCGVCPLAGKKARTLRHSRSS